MPRVLTGLLLPVLLFGQAPAPDASPLESVPQELQKVWQQYEQLIRKYPEQPLLHYNFGNLAYTSGEYQKALQEYQAAMSTGDLEAQAR